MKGGGNKDTKSKKCDLHFFAFPIIGNSLCKSIPIAIPMNNQKNLPCFKLHLEKVCLCEIIDKNREHLPCAGNPSLIAHASRQDVLSSIVANYFKQ